MPTITTASVPGGTVGVSYSATLQASGGTPPYTWSLDSGSLPAGLTLNSSTGAITGTPTAAGTSPFTAKVSDSAMQSDTQPLSITVAPAPVSPPTITTTGLPDGRVGTTYGQTLAAVDGTPPYTWSVSEGTLPSGLTLVPTGELAGQPTSAGSFTFTVRVDDAGTPSQSDTQELAVTIDPEPVPPPTVTTTSFPEPPSAPPYSATLQATGGTRRLYVVARLGFASGRSEPRRVDRGDQRHADERRSVVLHGQGDGHRLADRHAGPVDHSHRSTPVTATPSATTLLAGSPRGGSASDLASNDDSYFEINSTTSGQKTTDWYGSFSGVTNSLSNLRVSYAGKNSRSCTQTVSIWNWNNTAGCSSTPVR